DVEKLTSANSKNPQVLMTACAACHHPENQLVGPALAEIRKRYANNPDGIVEWAMNPQNKNPQLPSMPSFQFLGKEKLRIIAEAILAGE
ncbi:MAG: c-type cytochrome, partial [Akkermansiaceae bacterium]